MQPIKQLAQFLAQTANPEQYLFALRDLSAVIPGQSPAALKTLATRAEKMGLLRRVCRGLYLYPTVQYPAGVVLFHAAARLRAQEFNYISLETALSDAGVISQIPMNWVTLMSSGRSHVVDCGSFGHIEFVHTKKSAGKVAAQLTYDARCRLWRASVALALRDMASTRRNTDLIQWEVANELI